MTKLPLWFGLVLPLGLIGVLHFILLSLLLIKVMYNNYCNSLNLNSDWHESSSMKNTKLASTAIVFTLVSCAVYSGCVFGLLFVHPQLEQYSKTFQITFSICVTSQGVLIFTYFLYFSDNTSKFWISHLKANNFKSLILCVRCNGSQQNTNVISTNTNEAYESVRIRRRNERYTVTENEAYGQLGKPTLYVNTAVNSV